MSNLMYPYAALKNNPATSIHVDTAIEKHINDEFICLGCGDPMLLCNGEIVQPYFRHHVIDNLDCNAESVAHKVTKDYIFRTLSAAEKIDVRHRHLHNDILLADPVTFTIDTVVVERNIEANGSTYRPDILVTDIYGNQLAIEIVATNPPSAQKIKDYRLGVIFLIVVDATLEPDSTIEYLYYKSICQQCSRCKKCGIARDSKFSDYCFKCRVCPGCNRILQDPMTFDTCYDCYLKTTKECPTPGCSKRVKAGYNKCYTCNQNTDRRQLQHNIKPFNGQGIE